MFLCSFFAFVFLPASCHIIHSYDKACHDPPPPPPAPPPQVAEMHTNMLQQIQFHIYEKLLHGPVFFALSRARSIGRRADVWLAIRRPGRSRNPSLCWFPLPLPSPCTSPYPYPYPYPSPPRPFLNIARYFLCGFFFFSTVKEVLDHAVGAETARGWCSLAERALVAFGGNPLPQGRADSAAAGWWGSLRPLTPRDESLAAVSEEVVAVAVVFYCVSVVIVVV